MYNVSQAYIDVMRSNTRPPDEVYGTVYFPDETTLTISPSIMPTNSITISKQCTDGDELMFGGVFLSTLKLSLNTVRPRYDFYGATIELYYKVRTGFDNNDDPIYEVVPLGKYVVADADRPHNTVTVTAYDSMRLLDIDLGDKVLQGNAWTILNTISTDTGYELAFTEEDMTEYPNYDVLMQLDGTRGVNTYRDALKCVCQLLGCFGQDDRTGNLELRQFSSTITTTLTKAHWYSLVPADYECNYIALSVTGLGGTFDSSDNDPDARGNVMIIDDAPAWDYGVEEQLQLQTDDLFTYLKTIGKYTPCDIDMPSDPAFDCGDRLALVINPNVTISSLITSYEWKWHNGMSITSEGVNPYQTGVSVQEFGSRILTQEVADNKVQFYSFTNPLEHVLGDEQSAKIGSLKFVTVTKTTAMFVATILVDVSADDIEVDTEEEVEVPVTAYDYEGNEYTFVDENDNPITFKGLTTVHHSYKRDGHATATIWYALNDVVYPYLAIDNLTAGKHIITVSYPITGLNPNVQYTWDLFMQADDGTITVPLETLRATIFGQGLSDANVWDGNIEISDDCTRFDIKPISTKEFEDGELTLIKFCTPDDEDYDNEHLSNLVELEDDANKQKIIFTKPKTFGEVTTGQDAFEIILTNIVYNLISEDGEYNIVSEDGNYRISTED